MHRVVPLLSTVHELNLWFEYTGSTDVRGNFLDISKAFDWVWYQGLLYKLESYGVRGKSKDLLTNYLHDGVQKVVSNGQCSNRECILSDILQGFVLDPLLFMIYINDLQDQFNSICKIPEYDTPLLSPVHDKNSSQDELNNVLEKINYWVFL